MKKILTVKDLDELKIVAIDTLISDDNMAHQPWCKSIEEAEEWMGDWFFDAVENILTTLGFVIDYEEEETEE